MADHFGGRQKLLYIWRRKNGLCPICAQKTTGETGWHPHHQFRRVDGGTDAASNLCLLHPVCHMQGHSTGFRMYTGWAWKPDFV